MYEAHLSRRDHRQANIGNLSAEEGSDVASCKTCKYNININININIYYYILLISLSFIYFYYRLYIEYYIYNYYYNIYNISLYYVQEFQDQAQESLMFLQLRMIMDN